MARQVMEHHGYQLDQMGVRLRRNELFLSAARYKSKKIRAPLMVLLFICKTTNLGVG
jgi:hypothetical protein